MRRGAAAEARTWRIVPWALLVAAWVIGAALTLALRDDRTWTNDEGIAYLEVTCHLDGFNAAVRGPGPPYATWVEAATWQRLTRSEGQLCLSLLGRQLATQDVHPPLYYWLLQLWTLVAGTGLLADLALNLLFQALATYVVFRTGTALFASRLDGAAAALVASLCPVAAYATMEIRPYALLGLVTAVYVLVLIRVVRPAQPPSDAKVAALLATTTAGALTHHLFAFVVLAGGAYALWHLARCPRRLLRVGVATVAGYALAALAFPMLAQLRGPRSTLVHGLLPTTDRPAAIAATAATLWPAPPVVPLVVAAACAVAIAWLALRSSRLPRVRTSAQRGADIAILAVIVAALLVLQFAIGVSPPHAMAAKYLAPVWPLCGLLAAVAWRACGRWRGAVAAVICLFFAVPAVERIAARRALLTAAAPLQRVTNVIVDNTTRLELPRVMALLPPDARVYVAEQPYLLAHGAAPLPAGFTYAHYVGDEASRQRSEAISRMFAATHEARESEPWFDSWDAQRFVQSPP